MNHVSKSECLYCRTRLLVHRNPDLRDLLCIDCFHIAEDIEADEIATWIGDSLSKKGIRVLQAKEKFGHPRVYCLLIETRLPFPFRQIHSLYAGRVYAKVYKEALAKWPDRRVDILAGADYPELIGR